jgi:hypothetical protein
MGENEFVDGEVSAGLELRVDKKKRHGEIGPIEPTSIAVYQANLGATRDQWVIDEQ